MAQLTWLRSAVLMTAMLLVLTAPVSAQVVPTDVVTSSQTQQTLQPGGQVFIQDTSAIEVDTDKFVSGSPDLTLSSPRNHFKPNDRANLTVQITNNGELHQAGLPRFQQHVQTARNVRIDVQEDSIAAPIEVTTGPIVVGRLQTRTTQTNIGLEIGDADPGRYRIPVEVSYDYTGLISYKTGGKNPTYSETSDVTDTKYIDIVVEESAQFEITSAETQALYAGDTGSFTVTYTNNGTEIARDASAQFTTQTGSIFFGSVQRPKQSTTVSLGTVRPGESESLSLSVGATDNLLEGSYPVQSIVSYDNEYDVPVRADPQTISVDVGPERQFELRNLTTENLRVGTTNGQISGTIVNTGAAPSVDTTVQISPSGPINATRPVAGVGTLGPGDHKPVSFDLVVPSTVEPGDWSTRFVASYDNQNGDLRQSDPIRKTVEVREEMTFNITNLETTRLRVGENDVIINATITNTGSSPANTAVVALNTSPPVQVTSPESAVGTLNPGESAPVSFRLAVPENTEPGSQPLDFNVVYENTAGNVAGNVRPIRKSVTIASERETFDVVNVDSSLHPGGTSTVTVKIRHTGSERITDANAKIFVNDPLSAANNEAFIGTLEPGETTTVKFELEATGSALPKEYATSIQIRYEDTDGDSKLADGLNTGVTVSRGGGGLPLTFVGLGAGLVAVAGGITVYWRRD